MQKHIPHTIPPIAIMIPKMITVTYNILQSANKEIVTNCEVKWNLLHKHLFFSWAFHTIFSTQVTRDAPNQKICVEGYSMFEGTLVKNTEEQSGPTPTYHFQHSRKANKARRVLLNQATTQSYCNTQSPSLKLFDLSHNTLLGFHDECCVTNRVTALDFRDLMDTVCLEKISNTAVLFTTWNKTKASESLTTVAFSSPKVNFKEILHPETLTDTQLGATITVTMA